MIFAAGLGTRLRPLTNNMPKAMVPVAGKPMLQRVIENLAHYGFHDIIVNVHHFGEQIIDFLAQNYNFGQNIVIYHWMEGLSLFLKRLFPIKLMCFIFV